MSLAHATLVAVEVVCTQLAATPPNKTPSKGRYHTEEIFVLRIAPFLFAVQSHMQLRRGKTILTGLSSCKSRLCGHASSLRP
jgi:hypothetical protein